MPKTLNQDIKMIQFVPVQVLAETTNGAAKDMQVNEMFSFETVLADVEIGNLGSQALTKVKIQESDSATFASGVTTAEGGDEITVSADTSYKMEVQRTKRYLRAVVTLTTPGGGPSVEIFIGGMLWNASRPYPIV